MATVTSATTEEAVTYGGTTRFLFKYVFDIGETHYRRAWVPAGTDEAAERSRRQTIMLVELADAEAINVVGSA